MDGFDSLPIHMKVFRSYQITTAEDYALYCELWRFAVNYDHAEQRFIDSVLSEYEDVEEIRR